MGALCKEAALNQQNWGSCVHKKGLFRKCNHSCYYFGQVELYGREMNESRRKIDDASGAPTTTPSAVITLETATEAGSSGQVKVNWCIAVGFCFVQSCQRKMQLTVYARQHKLVVSLLPPTVGIAEAAVKIPSAENPGLMKGSLFQAWCRSEHGLACLTFCREFYLSDLYHPGSFNLFCCQIHSPFFDSVGVLFLFLFFGSLQNKIVILLIVKSDWCSFPCWEPVEHHWLQNMFLDVINGSLTSACDLMNCVLSLYFNFKYGYSWVILTVDLEMSCFWYDFNVISFSVFFTVIGECLFL